MVAEIETKMKEHLLTHSGNIIYRACVEMNACICTYVHNHKIHNYVIYCFINVPQFEEEKTHFCMFCVRQ
jgi:hypothetical protein